MDKTQDSYIGTVDWYSRKLNYGFIISGDQRYFVHRKDIKAALGFQKLEMDEAVQFELGMFHDRAVAINVRRIAADLTGGAK